MCVDRGLARYVFEVLVFFQINNIFIFIIIIIVIVVSISIFVFIILIQ